jgi:hypothetical protein
MSTAAHLRGVVINSMGRLYRIETGGFKICNVNTKFYNQN